MNKKIKYTCKLIKFNNQYLTNLSQVFNNQTGSHKTFTNVNSDMFNIEIRNPNNVQLNQDWYYTGDISFENERFVFTIENVHKNSRRISMAIGLLYSLLKF